MAMLIVTLMMNDCETYFYFVNASEIQCGSLIANWLSTATKCDSSCGSLIANWTATSINCCLLSPCGFLTANWSVTETSFDSRVCLNCSELEGPLYLFCFA